MLELAKREAFGPVPIGEVAQAQQIPSRFLEAILRQLKQGGFTDSVRGKDGGYRLARPAADIKLGDIIKHFEGPLICVNPKATLDDERPDVFNDIWQKAETALDTVFDTTTIGELAKRDIELQETRSHNYNI